VEKLLQNSPETEAIRQRMEEVRCDLDEDVQEIVEGARDMGKWRSYVKAYPWVFMGAAFAVGYLIVPRRLLGTQPNAKQPPESAHPSVLPPSSPMAGMRSKLLAFVGTLVLRGVASYFEQQAGKFFATLSAKSAKDGPA
jgi:hypothetical protein